MCCSTSPSTGRLELRRPVTGDNRGFRHGRLLVMGGTIDRQFLLGVEATLGGSGVLRLHGGAEPLNRPGSTSSVLMPG